MLTLSAAPAGAATQIVTDPSDDAAGRGLDVTRVAVHNQDRRVVVRVRFVEAVRGDLIVSVDPRGARGVRLVSEHRPGGTTTSYVLPWAFTDAAARRTVPCRGFRVRWDLEAETARLVMPSRCLRGGDYGAIRFAVLTERRGGDVDFAPESPEDSTWIPRG